MGEVAEEIPFFWGSERGPEVSSAWSRLLWKVENVVPDEVEVVPLWVVIVLNLKQISSHVSLRMLIAEP